MRLDRVRQQKRIHLQKFAGKYLDTMSPGDTINIHHCKSGHNNDRMYITYLEDGSGWVGYCHHCNRSGFYFNSKAHRMFYKSIHSTIKETEAVEQALHIDDVQLHGALASFGTKTKNFLALRGLTASDIIEHNGRLDDEVVLIPVGSITDPCGAGYQTRFISPKEGYPKVISNQLHPNAYILKPKIELLEHNLVIVEDFFSAIIVCRELLVPTLWLGGTSLHSKQIQSIRELDPDRIVVWLDNDNTIVMLNVEKITQELHELGWNVQKIRTPCADPKYLYKNDPKIFNDVSNSIHEYFTST